MQSIIPILKNKIKKLKELTKLPKDTVKKILYINGFTKNIPAELLQSEVISAECAICYSSEGMQYSHNTCVICVDCWETYVKTSHDYKSCPICTKVIMPLTLSDAELMREYIKCKWHKCSYCNIFIKNNNVGSYSCPCPNELCSSFPNKLCRYNCGFISHTPACCEAIVAWNQNIDSQSPDITYIKSIAKACPKCAVFIIKDSDKSCLKMHCTSCEFVFCWKCLSDYSTHDSDFYSCKHETEITNNIRADIITQFMHNNEALSGNAFLKKYLQVAQNYLKQEYYESFMHNRYEYKYEYNKFVNIMNVLNHDFEGFINTIGRLNMLYKLLKKNKYDGDAIIPYVPKNPDSIIYWDADYNHNDPAISYHMENILNNSMLTIYFDIGETELITEYYYINFVEMTIADINYPPAFSYTLSRYLFPPWKCPECTMHNFPKLTRLQACSACYAINVNTCAKNRLVL
jgi:hypothetical protein